MDPRAGYAGYMNLGALRSRDYRRYFVGNLFALNGMWLGRVTIAWIAWDMTGQASFVGWIAFLVFAPTIVSGPVFGVLADRAPLKQAAFAAQAGLAAALLALLLAARAGALSPGLLALLALAIGIISSAHHPVRLALTPSLVARAAIGSAVALGSLNFNLARLTGPAVGGVMIASLGAPAALGIAVLCLLPTLAILPGLDPRPAARAEPGLGLVPALRDGVAYAAQVPLIRRAMAVIGLFSLIARGLLEILPVLADGVFARGPSGLGALAAAAGAGALAAATLIALGRVHLPGELPLSSRLAAPAGLLLVAALGWNPHWLLALALVAGLGLCGTLVGVGLQASVQLVVADAYRARVMSLWTLLAVGGAAVGALALGGLIDLLGHRLALSLAAGFGLAMMGFLQAAPLAAAAHPGTSRAEQAPHPASDCPSRPASRLGAPRP